MDDGKIDSSVAPVPNMHTSGQNFHVHNARYEYKKFQLIIGNQLS